MKVTRRYPLQALADALGVPVQSLARHCGVSGSTWQEYRDLGVSERVADRLACRMGLHPYVVWPQLADDVLEDTARPCPECGEGFHPSHGNQRFCHPKCANRNRKRRRARERYHTDPAFRAAQIAKAKTYDRENARAKRIRQKLYRERNRDALRAYAREYRQRMKEAA